MLIKLSILHKKYNLNITGISHFGAHLGQEVASYRDLDIKNIHLFEPQKNIYEKLKKKFSNDEDISLYNFGLGANDQNVNINLAPGNSGLSASILTPGKHKKYYPDIKFSGTEEIEIKIYDNLNIPNVNFLNIDIQGYEIEALKGSTGALKNKIDYVFIEVSRKPLYEHSALVSDIDEFLGEYNFIRVRTRWASSKVPWADSFYVKKNSINKLQLYESHFHKFFEKYFFYYLFIDPYRKYRKLKYKTKQRLKKFIT
jgi:FkbM family methyltransferase